jgi:hypothetical protein
MWVIVTTGSAMRTDEERACEWLEANGHGAVEHCVALSGGDTCDSSSIGLTFLKYSCDSGWITNAKRFTR